MAGKLKSLKVEPPEVVEDAEGQTKSWKKTEDLLAMVKKLQKEGSLEPQIEDLINRINELQQAKKKSSEELGEAQALWEALHRELDSLNGEKVHLEEVLSKKQEALRILQLHCQSKEGEAQRLHVEEQLEDLMDQHKDLWEFHMLEQRLTWEIRALQSSKQQLLTEEKQARAKLKEVGRRLRSPPEVEGALAVHDELEEELEKLGGQVPAQTQSTPEGGVGLGEDALPPRLLRPQVCQLREGLAWRTQFQVPPSTKQVWIKQAFAACLPGTRHYRRPWIFNSVVREGLMVDVVPEQGGEGAGEGVSHVGIWGRMHLQREWPLKGCEVGLSLVVLEGHLERPAWWSRVRRRGRADNIGELLGTWSSWALSV
ncbi:synaptonemal complex central element protein 1-like [Diceros bicornis minor]|uniref:synaptonemal complex central element protein 1-like n=1 Tax=Diceros bicornis minor TaxID=77932 RepID=UPI0026F21F5B|nr:synaptonemal complex central element protein 1-like [Diceros bicornis minor]